jgi:hypothetical protein
VPTTSLLLGTTNRCCIAPVGNSSGVSLAPLVARYSGYWFPAAVLFLSASAALLAHLTCIRSKGNH